MLLWRPVPWGKPDWRSAMPAGIGACYGRSPSNAPRPKRCSRAAWWVRGELGTGLGIDLRITIGGGGLRRGHFARSVLPLK
jgi:hypothetical protein